MLITITKVLDPARRIVAIKALRAASNPTLGLRDSKLAVDHLADGGEAFNFDGDVTPDLTACFTVSVAEHAAAELKALAIEFILDVLAWSDPETAQQILQLKSYRALKAAL